MGKKGNKSAKSGGDFWDDEDLAQDAPQGEEFGESNGLEGSEVTSPAPEGADTASADEVSGDFLSSIRKSKQKKAEKVVEEKNKPKDAPKVLSKKEKEKLKKEAEKQKKKEQAAIKKAQQADKKEQIKEANKQNAAAASTTSSPAEGNTPEPEAKVSTKKGGKKVPAGIAALKRQLELKKQLEEEQRRLDEEEDERRAEEEKKVAEAEAEQEANRAAKKEKERAKKEQLKAEGKLLTKKQKEEKKLQERRRQQLLQGNVSVPGLEGNADEAPKPKKIVYGKKKSTKPKTFIQHNKVQSQNKTEETKGGDDDIVEDWEKMALEDDEPIADDWEAALNDEDDEANPYEKADA